MTIENIKNIKKYHDIFDIFDMLFFKNIKIVSNPARRYSVDTAKHILNFFTVR